MDAKIGLDRRSTAQQGRIEDLDRAKQHVIRKELCGTPDDYGDQFVVERMPGTKDKVRIRGGVVTWVRRAFDGAGYVEERTTYAPSTASVLWTWAIALYGSSAHSAVYSNEFAVTADTEIWMYFNSYVGSGNLEFHRYAAPHIPTSATRVYWRKIATIKWDASASEISQIQQHRQGAQTFSTPTESDASSSPTTIAPTTASAATSPDPRWRSCLSSGLQIRRQRIHLDSGSTPHLGVTWWYEYYNLEGLLDEVGPESDDDEFSPEWVTVVTEMQLTITGSSDDHTHALQYKIQDVLVLAKQAESGWLSA